MKVLRISIILIVVLLFSACRSDEFEEMPDTNPIPTQIPIYVTGNLNGLIVDENQLAIPGAEVELDGKTTTSDEYGIFSFNNVKALSTGSLVTIKREGYFNGYKFTNFQPGENSILKVELVHKEILTSYPSSEQRTINVNGAQLYLPENITTQEDGTPYVGTVNVVAHWYDPTDEHTITTMPGDLRGVNIAGAAVQLTTYGMMAVELSDDNGQELQLKPGMTATMTLPLPQNANGPEQIPMWHLDEQRGVWVEEGKAIRSGGAMIAEVAHFSFWNCDDPFDLVKLTGRIVTRPGLNPVSGLQIVITDIDQMISGYGYTNNGGVFSGLVPMGNDLTMSIFHCGELLSFRNLGTLTEDHELPDTYLEIAEKINLSASLVDCNEIPVAEGLAIISTENSMDLVVAFDGQINFSLFPCSTGEGTFQALDNEKNEASEQIKFDLGATTIDLEEVIVCNIPNTEQLVFNIMGGDTESFMDATVSIIDDTYIHFYAERQESSLVFIEFRYYLDGVTPLEGTIGTETRLRIGAFNDLGNYITSTVHDSGTGNPAMTWDLNDGDQVGDYITGTIEHPATNTTVFCNLKIDQIVKTSSVSGNIWMDSNKDGIQQDDETDSVPNQVNISAGNGAGFSSYYQFFKVNADGSYSLTGLAPDQEYSLSASMPFMSGLVVTSYQQGNDNTKDNDFVSSGGEFANNSSRFSLDVEEVLPNIGLGIHQQ